jgi:hypothetical protein
MRLSLFLQVINERLSCPIDGANNMSMEDGFSPSWTWKLLMCDLKEQRVSYQRINPIQWAVKR